MEADRPVLPYLFQVQEDELPDLNVLTEMLKPEHAGLLEMMTGVTVHADEAEAMPGSPDRLNFMWGFSVAMAGTAKALRARGFDVPRFPFDPDSQAYYGSLVASLRKRKHRERVHKVLLESEMPLLRVIAREQGIENDPDVASFEAGLIGGYAVMSEATAIRQSIGKIRWD